MERIASLGFKKLEVMTFPPHLWPRGMQRQDREVLRRQLESYGLQVVASQANWLDLNLASYNPGVREESVRQMKECIELLHDLGGKAVVIQPGRLDGVWGLESEQDARQFSKESISACVEYAERLGITLAIETSIRNFMRTGREVVELIEEIGSPAVQACVDVSNVNTVQSPLEALEEAKDHLAHMHLADNDGKIQGKWAVGEGNVDFAAVARKLEEIDFKEVSIVEILSRNPDEAFLKSKDRLEKLGWRA